MASRRLLSKWSNVGSRSGGRGVGSLDDDSRLGPWIDVKGKRGRVGGGGGGGVGRRVSTKEVNEESESDEGERS